jgi:diaminohydroxyphosphoribosylaminopyrimidine deaminase/5-amino-6-(5-phosphoribosylamino)uracil reductase
MRRCLQLAKLGMGAVAPNPMVGAALVYNDRIIGEGFHQVYGKAHAEVNCINSVSDADRILIPSSTLYVSLEPCVHFGKTPPCADMVIQQKIPRVVIGCRDPFEKVDGKGIEKLRASGIDVETGILEAECLELNKRFFTFHKKHRPYVILKWAQTADGFIANPGPTNDRLRISNDYSNRLVHKWRSEEASIMIGTNTAMKDDPELTTRLWPGKSPIRLVLDLNLQLPRSLKVFDQSVKTIVFNSIKEEEDNEIQYFRLTSNENIVLQMLNALHQMNIQSVLVEGGATLLQSFVDAGKWDEVRVITNTQLTLGNDQNPVSGLRAPVLRNVQFNHEKILGSDLIKKGIRVETQII